MNNKIISIYNDLSVYADNSLINEVLINSDISCKAYLIKNMSIYYIDCESYCFGNINADYAGLFYSSVNTFFEDVKMVKMYYDFF